MSRHKHGCGRTRISFKTKRGKHVSFVGRPDGDSKYGGKCPAKRKPFNHEFARVARMCSRKVHARGTAKFLAMSTCVADGMR